MASDKIDGFEAFTVHRKFQAKVRRTIVQDDCEGSNGEATNNGVGNCASLAAAARAAARNDPSRLEKYFKSSSEEVASKVEGVFAKIEEECASTTEGASRYHCSDVYGACKDGVLAYTMPSQNYMVNCPAYFDMPAQNSQCHGQDQAS